MASKSKRPKGIDTTPPPAIPHESGNQAGILKTIVTIESLPSEVLEYILADNYNIPNINKLKTCRFVSKSWNDICCHILRKVFAVPLKLREGEADLEKFKDLIIDRLENFPSDWPNPFQNFKILEAPTVTTNMVRFVERANVKITTLEIIQDKDFDPLAFESLLEHINGDLVHLKIRVIDSDSSGPFLILPEKLVGGGWRSLKSLTLKDTCKATPIPCPHVKFLNALKTNLILLWINLDGELTNITKIFEKEDACWDKLLCLELRCKASPLNLNPEQIYQIMKWTEEINFRPLTRLQMWFGATSSSPYHTSEQYTPYVLPLIQKSCQVLVGLRETIVPLSLLPSLPNLEHLTCCMMDGDRIQDITEQKFPSLTSVYCILHWTEIPTYASPKDLENNTIFETVTVFWSSGVPAGVTQDLLWHALRVHFPNLKSLSLQVMVTSATLHGIRKRLPQLPDLQLRAATSSELLGSSSGPAYSAKGWPCESYENCALLEMTKLTRLQLGKLVTVSNDVMSVCLGKLPKIQFLSFYWNNDLQPFYVPAFLGHIKDVAIFYSGTQQKRELEKLTKTMKQLQLIKY